ncbi:hypothetical protein [Paenibacillus wenxiniae]|uniref:Uncharacterized protein n=1 Tax=Paenibacillus wenxiniae TaxID=1636843 RepID=A0ABW4RDY3_9BACL
MKEASVIKVGSREGFSKFLFATPAVAEISVSVDRMLQASTDPDQSISGHMAVLDSEVDGLRMAINCGEPANVVREECIAAIARLVQVYNTAGDRDGGAQ